MENDIDFARYDRIRPILWTGETLDLLDQRKLPFEVEHLSSSTSDEVAAAIHSLAVRGAPAIGIAAAWGVVLAARAIEADDGAEAALKLEPALQRLNAARPTAVNLAWALARMRRVLQACSSRLARGAGEAKPRPSRRKTWPRIDAWARWAPR